MMLYWTTTLDSKTLYDKSLLPNVPYHDLKNQTVSKKIVIRTRTTLFFGEKKACKRQAFLWSGYFISQSIFENGSL